jgi:hypothetical protein
VWHSGSIFPWSQPFVPQVVSGTNFATKIIQPQFPTDDVIISDIDAVVDRGVDNSGVAFVSDQINQLLSECESQGGGTVWLRSGVYKLNHAIRIPPFCSLRGDWNDPKSGTTATQGFGTVLIAVTSPSDASYWTSNPVITIGGSAGINGVTIYYSGQSLANVLPYYYTIEVPGGGGAGMYMASSVERVTLLNAYSGIAISQTSATHELATVRQIRGTVLSNGLYSTNSADVDVYEDISFDNTYWLQAGTGFSPPTAAALNAYTRQNVTAYLLGNLEMAQFVKVSASDCHTGIRTFQGTRPGSSTSLIWYSVVYV